MADMMSGNKAISDNNIGLLNTSLQWQVDTREAPIHLSLFGSKRLAVLSKTFQGSLGNTGERLMKRAIFSLLIAMLVFVSCSSGSLDLSISVSWTRAVVWDKDESTTPKKRKPGWSAAALAREFEPSAPAIRNWVKQAEMNDGRRSSDGATTRQRKKK